MGKDVGRVISLAAMLDIVTLDQCSSRPRRLRGGIFAYFFCPEKSRLATQGSPKRGVKAKNKTCFLTYLKSFSLNTFRIIFPVAVIGSSSTNSTCRGYS